MRKSLELGALVGLSYALLVANTRFIAEAGYVGMIATDAAIALCGFTLFKRMQQAETRQDKACYVLGACLGSAVSLWLTS